MSPTPAAAVPPQGQQQRAAPAAAAATTGGGGVFVDAITGKHVATDAASLLQRRSLVWKKDYGWTYDVWVDDPGRYALTGANSRFSLPAVGQRIAGLLTDAATAATSKLQAALARHQQWQQQHQQQQQQQQRGNQAAPAQR